MMASAMRLAAAARVINVGIGQIHVSGNPLDVLVAPHLGSCVAVVLHDPKTLIGGIAHIQSPGSDSGKPPAPVVPPSPDESLGCASRGVPVLIDRMIQAGANRGRCRAVLVGGASTLSSSQYFQIGRRNHLAIKQILWQFGILVGVERIGGTRWRTVKLHVDSGRILISNPQGHEEV